VAASTTLSLLMGPSASVAMCGSPTVTPATQRARVHPARKATLCQVTPVSVTQAVGSISTRLDNVTTVLLTVRLATATVMGTISRQVIAVGAFQPSPPPTINYRYTMHPVVTVGDGIRLERATITPLICHPASGLTKTALRKLPRTSKEHRCHQTFATTCILIIGFGSGTGISTKG